MIFVTNTLFLVLGLGLTCTIGYGTVYYSFSLMSLEIEQAFGWSSEFIFGCYSLGIFLSGLAAPVIGRYLDLWGAPYLMSAGSLVVALCFLGLSQMDSRFEFIFFLLLMEVLLTLIVYESAFVAITHAVGQQARLPITQITLMAGFASTIFWPLISWLLTITDWRSTYLILGAMHILICLPIHFLLLKSASSGRNANKEDKGKKVAPITKVEVMVAIALGVVAFCISGIHVHLFNILSALSVTDKIAVLVGVLLGPMQVVSRLIDLLFAQRYNPIYLGIISISCMLLGVVFLLFAFVGLQAVVLFSLAFGLGQGLTYITR